VCNTIAHLYAIQLGNSSFWQPAYRDIDAPAVNPVTSDFDADGLNDLVEWQLSTNPKVANTNTASVSTDSWSVVFSNNPSDSDGDGVIDALEDASSVKMASKVTGLPVSACRI